MAIFFLIVGGALFYLMRYLGNVWGIIASRSGPFFPPIFQRGARADPASNSRKLPGVIQLTDDSP